jgi:hypothetical protein
MTCLNKKEGKYNLISQSKILNASISIIQGNEVKYLSYPDGEGGFAVDEYTLYQIGSVSKSFTGLGILLLEDNDLLSLDDLVNKYLPWFTVSYDGKAVSSDELTIADCLYQTSGFTNNEAKYLSAKEGMSLEDSVRQINKSELAFYPHSRFSYANANYRILGLIIETVSEQFYRIIEKSHQPDPQSIIDDTTRYAAGWYANAKTGAIYHSGGTPNYSANVEIRSAVNSAVCVLTNMNASANINYKKE